MISQDEFLLQTVRRLSEAGIPYMITGSYGSNFHGEPRSTADIDVVIAPAIEQIEAFIEALGEAEYADLGAAKSALERHSMFNVIDTVSGWKLDLIVRKSRPFSIEEFRRRRPVTFMGTEIFIVSAEDIILSKLEWAKRGESERQLRDAESVAVLQYNQLDFEYLRKWAPALSVAEELEQLLDRASQLQDPEPE